jgi:hypothetical protein
MTQNFLKVPTFTDNQDEQNRLTANAINNILDGKINSTGTFTTTGTKTLETVIDARCGGNSVVLWSPLTVDAAGEMTHMWLAATRNGEFDIGHRNHSKNVVCKYVIIG